MKSVKKVSIVILLSIAITSVAAADTDREAELDMSSPIPLDLMPQDARMPADPTTPDDLPKLTPAEMTQRQECEPVISTESTCPDKCGFLCWPTSATLMGPLSTDRPGFADTTFVIPRGHAQLELGYTSTFDSENRTRSNDHTIGQTNLRVGVLDNLEFRTLWSGFSMTETDFDAESPRTGRRYRATDHNDGAGDMTLGLRTQLVKNVGFVPDLTLLTNMSIPVGSNNKTAGDVVPDGRLAYGWALNEKLRLYGVGIIAAGVHATGRFAQASASTGLSYAITDRVGSFVEYYGIFPGRENEDCSHNADGGMTFLLSDNCQLDFSAGVGLNEQAADYFLGMGLSFRW